MRCPALLSPVVPGVPGGKGYGVRLGENKSPPISPLLGLAKNGTAMNGVMYNPETTYLGLGNGRCNGLLYGEGCVGGGNRAFDCI